MPYHYVRSINAAQQWLDVRPLNIDFLTYGLFDPDYLSAFAKPAGDVCTPYDSPSFPRRPEPVPVGPNARTPLDSLDELQNGRGPRDSVGQRLEALEREWRRGQLREQSRWRPNRSGPPPRPLPPMQHETRLPPLNQRAAGRAAGAALVASGVILLHRHSMIAQLRNRLDGLGGTINGLLKRSRYRQVLCSVVYSFFVFADEIGNNDPQMAAISVLTPPDLRGESKVGLGRAFDHFDFLFAPKPRPGEQFASAAPHKQHIYGDYKRHFAANRDRAVGYILVSG